MPVIGHMKNKYENKHIFNNITIKKPIKMSNEPFYTSPTTIITSAEILFWYSNSSQHEKNIEKNESATIKKIVAWKRAPHNS